jgi:hypothetical protein
LLWLGFGVFTGSAAIIVGSLLTDASVEDVGVTVGGDVVGV